MRSKQDIFNSRAHVVEAIAVAPEPFLVRDLFALVDLEKIRPSSVYGIARELLRAGKLEVTGQKDSGRGDCSYYRRAASFFEPPPDTGQPSQKELDYARFRATGRLPVPDTLILLPEPEDPEPVVSVPIEMRAS